jgi:hypothetical protein
MSINVYVVHNARKDVGIDSDIWLVIDTVSGTAISKHSTREEAEKDLAIVTAFYERWPSGNPTESAYAPEGVDEDGRLLDNWQPCSRMGSGATTTLAPTPELKRVRRIS